ncbi:MAG TPA: anaerobic sulfatase maturase [Bacteroidales bacterium]|nr:anaerobic sulfatase maturase [Bacteroidales bacterium]
MYIIYLRYMVETNREFQVLIKPVGARCNMACTYCYYLDKQNLYPGKKAFRMSEHILEEYIKQHIECTSTGAVNFSWHGGEPLLAGLGYFRKITEMQKKHLPENKRLINGIQTNGMLINDEWCRFFSDNNFIIGLSMDGLSYLHDIYRRTLNGKPTFSRVKKSYMLLREYGISTEILCTVNAENVMYPVQVYEFFRALGVEFITFIPVVERLPGCGLAGFTVPAGDYGAFLCTIFDQWKSQDIGRIKIQIFEEALRTAFNQDHTLCIFKETCGGVPILEVNGDLYSCDHFVDSNHLLGNIQDISLAEMLDSPEQTEFGENKLKTLPSYCLECEVRDMCNGGCPRNRFISTPDGKPGLNYLCPGYKMIFNHIRSFADKVEKVWRQS